MPLTAEFIFDFASPNAYLSYKVLPGITERTGTDFRIVPCLLGGIFKATDNQAPMITYANVKGKLAYNRLEIERFVRKHGLRRFRFNEHFPVNTLMLMRGAIIADEAGRLADYVELGLRAMWEDSVKMDDPEIFVKTMNEGGFDGTALLKQTSEPSVKAKLSDNTAAAVERGVFGIPSFFVGQEMFFGKETLPLLEEEILAQKA